MVQMLCYLLECLLAEENTPPDCPKELYELYFVFAAVWAFGGSMFRDQLVDYRVEFSKWWVAEFKTIKFPSQGTVFDFYIDPETKKFEPWSKLIPQFEFDPEMPLQRHLETQVTALIPGSPSLTSPQNMAVGWCHRWVHLPARFAPLRLAWCPPPRRSVCGTSWTGSWSAGAP
ncbi:dynein axonemal heavy chain 9-like isoform X2 [Patagioenas fasciata]|uniref:dynein axonemal heavy chain 9-like isoform X2 n=1 Tax=Patagioenas fasciata TaxID=372321 RepID=UPI003A995452